MCNSGIDREAAAVLPLSHHLRNLRRQQDVPQGRAQQSPAHGGLNLRNRRQIQPVGQAKADATCRIGLETAIHHEAMEVQRGVQERRIVFDGTGAGA